MQTKSIIKELLPPVIFRLLKLLKKQVPQHFTWSGDYNSWDEAQTMSTGYDSENILEQCKSSLLKIKNGEAIYERDSVLFDKIQYSWGLLAGLQKAALANKGQLCVLDFGGSLGSTYYQNRGFLNSINKLEWCIVEQNNFVNCGNLNFKNEELSFYKSLEECLKAHQPNVLLLSGVLQYLENPYQWIEKFISLEIKTIIIDRTGFIDLERNVISVQNVPESIYKASYPCWFFNKEGFIKKFDEKYTLLSLFKNDFTEDDLLNGIKIYWEGLILNR